jgi:hypothetical protein
LKVRATDRHHPIVIAIPFKQFVAEAKEGGVRQAIVLKKDGLGHRSKDFGDTRGNALPTAHVLVGVNCSHVATPVNARNLIAHGTASFEIVPHMVTWSVCYDEECVWTSCRNALKDSPGSRGPVKHNERDRRSHLYAFAHAAVSK